MLIGVTGCSGSGKSSFVRFLQKYLPESQFTLFTQDNYYIKRELQPRDSNGIQNFDLPQSLDLDTYFVDLLNLKAGKPVVQNKYNYNNPDLPEERLIINPKPIIITEGLFVFQNPEFHPHFDHKVFIDSIDEISFSRRLYRDETERGYGFDDVSYRFYNHVLPSYLTYIAPQKEHCDVVIQNNANDLELLEQAAKEFVQRYF
jgi:uridine kinase